MHSLLLFYKEKKKGGTNTYTICLHFKNNKKRINGKPIKICTYRENIRTGERGQRWKLNLSKYIQYKYSRIFISNTKLIYIDIKYFQ